MPTGDQIRAARSLLGWKAEELAERAGVNRESVFRAERSKKGHRPLAETMEKITRVLNDEGIVFIGLSGVDRHSENYRVLEGADCYLRLLGEVKRVMLRHLDSEALFICVDDSVSTDEVRAANFDMRESGIRCRYLSAENAKKFDFDLKDYRVIPKEFYTNSVMIVYANRVATLRGTNDAVLIVIDEDQANMLRGLFELIWLNSASIDNKNSERYK